MKKKKETQGAGEEKLGIKWYKIVGAAASSRAVAYLISQCQ
jgi:hypothetical protein